jgi:lipopolysaccharide/colanic/teichoic acid biosynthesis glycosyltransferase
MKLYLFTKKILDFIFALFMLILLFPFLALTAILIKLESKGPVFFMQKRIGQAGKMFYVFKFRTMIDDAQNLGTGLKTDFNDPRITKLGHILRKLSIDELPQLINIIRGEMSFIGPRPVPPKLLEKFDVGNKIRLSVKPGISGWAQVNGRNSIAWPERILKDIWYVENVSFWLDLKVLYKTIVCILFGKDIYTGNNIEIVKSNSKI